MALSRRIFRVSGSVTGIIRAAEGSASRPARENGPMQPARSGVSGSCACTRFRASRVTGMRPASRSGTTRASASCGVWMTGSSTAEGFRFQGQVHQTGEGGLSRKAAADFQDCLCLDLRVCDHAPDGLSKRCSGGKREDEERVSGTGPGWNTVHRPSFLTPLYNVLSYQQMVPSVQFLSECVMGPLPNRGRQKDD